MDEVQRRARGQAQATDLAHGEASGVEHALGAAQRLGGTALGQEAADRGELELALRTGALALGVVQEVRRRLPELPGHVLE